MYCSRTTAWLSYNSPEPFVDNAKRVFNIPTLDGEGIGIFGTMYSGKCIEWVRLFDVQGGAEFDRIAAELQGSGGLIFLPYIEGERSPIFDPTLVEFTSVLS